MIQIVFIIWALLSGNPNSTTVGDTGTQVTTLDTGGDNGHIPPTPPPPPK
jgi:hypothetical protein